MNRLLYAPALTLMAVVTVAASPVPSPSPSLDQVLAAPPAGFTALTTGVLHGHVSADDYAAAVGDPSKKSEVVATLQRDGFVDGYGNEWVNRSSQHVLIELVAAFQGGDGARKWLSAVEVAEKGLASYQRPDTITGIGTYFGGHLYDASSKTYGDEFAFVKGNDAFDLVVASTKDDALADATAQATKQFDSAPAETIPSSQWPENQTNNSGAYQLGRAVGTIIVIVFVLGLIGFAVAAVMRRRRRSAAAAAVPMAGGAPGAVQMSPDGGYWWDGQAWREAAREAPPFAQRSSDGTLWWDGRAWRPVPPPAA